MTADYNYNDRLFWNANKSANENRRTFALELAYNWIIINRHHSCLSGVVKQLEKFGDETIVACLA